MSAPVLLTVEVHLRKTAHEQECCASQNDGFARILFILAVKQTLLHCKFQLNPDRIARQG
jgi:hypothetical protein